jgi:hypothetical protein
MATYKVIQDIEAEDKLVGPLTLKQFIFAAIAACFAFVAFMIASKTTIFAAIPFLPFILAFGIMAAPLGRDQPTDIWLAAKIRFFIKPRRRIWDQSGIKELVTITVPKRIEKHLSNGLSQQEVKSRLKALADTIDSHGWAIKNVDVNMYSSPTYIGEDSDRLIDPASLPQVVPDIDITAADDIMDISSPVAQHFNEMVQQSTQTQKASAIQMMQTAIQKQNNPTATNDTASTIDEIIASSSQAQLPPDSAMFNASVITPSQTNANDSFVQPDADTAITTADEQALLKHIKSERLKTRLIIPHHKIIETPEEIAARQAQAVTPPKDPVIVERVKNLANNSDDLTVASVAHLANRISQNDNDKEVVIKLR